MIFKWKPEKERQDYPKQNTDPSSLAKIENSGREITLKTQGEKAKERKDRRQSVLASGLKGGPAVREVGVLMRRMIKVIMLMMLRMTMKLIKLMSSMS